MEAGPVRDINELLLNGYFKTARGKSPSKPPVSPPSFLQAFHDDAPRQRSRSRGPHRPPPPRPTVEDEYISLAKEQGDNVPCYDPPMRGIVEQNPIILEAEVTEAEAARLSKLPDGKETEDRNAERRFVFIPRSGTSSSNSEDDVGRRQRDSKRDSGKSFQHALPMREHKGEAPPIERRRSRQDLPSLQTKAHRELPPQFRRSASAYASTPPLNTPQSSTSRTPASEFFLSPEAIRGSKDAFTPSQSAPRHHTNDTFGGRATPSSEKRNSGSFGGSRSESRPGTPSSEKRNSGNFDPDRRARKNSMEKLSRPQHLSEEYGGRRLDRQSERASSARSSRSSNHSPRHHYSSTDEDIVDSDSDHRRRRKHRSHKLHPGDDRHLRSASKSSNSTRPTKQSSRYSSPLPSPKVSPSQIPIADKFERSGTFPLMRRGSSRPVSPSGTPKADKLNPSDVPTGSRPGSRPESRHSSVNSVPIPIPMPIPTSRAQHTDEQGSLPIPIPSRIDVHSPGDTRRSPAIPQYGDDRPANAQSNMQPGEKPLWQPPKFQPPAHLDKPIGSYRRYSEDIERGSVTPLPTCPRKMPVRGRNDWLTLPQCQGFDICPSCYNSTMAPTEFRNMFVPAPFRPPEMEVVCNFGSSPWYRIAWLLTRKERRRDLNLFYGLARAGQTGQPCSGGRQAIRQWHSIIDPKTGYPIRNFDVCHSCVKSIETLLPGMRGIFVRTDAHLDKSTPRVCDLRFDSKRFVQYFDALETTADDAEEYTNAPIDTRNLASLVRRFAQVEECQRDLDLRDARWHVITQLPEFTVCEECFEEVVWPELDGRKAIPEMLHKSVQRLPKASCQLYSPKMRGIFRTAVDADDYKLLASKARERKTVESAYKANLLELKRMSGGAGMGLGNGAGNGKVLGNGNPRLKDEIDRITAEWAKWE